MSAQPITAVRGQGAVTTSLTGGGYIAITQDDDQHCSGESTIYVLPENVEQVIKALRALKRQALEAPPT